MTGRSLAADLRMALLDPLAWHRLARPEQLPPPGNWRIWLVLAGRGWGKTRTAAEWVLERVESGKARRIALVAPTAADARAVMVEGASGILACATERLRPLYEPSRRRLTWPNGAIATLYSADEPERLRGPQHDTASCDEIATWRYPEAWDMLMFGLRMGADPRVVATTTPRPVKLIRDLLADPATTVVRGSTYDNLANLAPDFVNSIVGRYAGTRLGRQELEAELLDDVPGALWARAAIDDRRVDRPPELAKIVVAIDPATTRGSGADETGIIVAGLGLDGEGYVLADLSGRFSPNVWARRAVDAYHTWHANTIVAEVNQGGDMVGSTIATVDSAVPFKALSATRGKRVRAEPVAARYEQGRIHHAGVFPALEDEMCMFLGDGSERTDDRVDALVWAFTELATGGLVLNEIPWIWNMWPCDCGKPFVWQPGRRCPNCGTPMPDVYDRPRGE
jgi:predicted phage terminase large subunit-like protein